jgi:O-antigen ligase
VRTEAFIHAQPGDNHLVSTITFIALILGALVLLLVGLLVGVAALAFVGLFVAVALAGVYALGVGGDWIRDASRGRFDGSRR